MDRFSATLSRKQLPTGKLLLVQQKIEFMMRNGEIEDMSGDYVPNSRAWLSGKMPKLKEQFRIKADNLVTDFLEKIKDDTNVEFEEQNSAQPLSGRSNEQDNAKDIEMLKADTDEEKEVIDNTSYITVGKTLKSVINQNFDYSTLLEDLQTLQTSCTKSIQVC